MPKPSNQPYTPPPRDYQGTELKTNPSIPTARLHAFTLPSRMGDTLFYPDGRALPFTGSDK